MNSIKTGKDRPNDLFAQIQDRFIHWGHYLLEQLIRSMCHCNPGQRGVCVISRI